MAMFVKMRVENKDQGHRRVARRRGKVEGYFLSFVIKFGPYTKGAVEFKFIDFINSSCQTISGRDVSVIPIPKRANLSSFMSGEVCIMNQEILIIGCVRGNVR